MSKRFLDPDDIFHDVKLWKKKEKKSTWKFLMERFKTRGREAEIR